MKLPDSAAETAFLKKGMKEGLVMHIVPDRPRELPPSQRKTLHMGPSHAQVMLSPGR
jgi:hypothetical protein